MNTLLKILGAFGLAAAAMSFFGRKSRRDALWAGKLGFGGGGTLGYAKGFGKGIIKGLKSGLRFRA